MVTIEDCVEAEEIVKADPSIQALLKDRYGVTDMDLVAADPWYYGDRFGESSHLLAQFWDFIQHQGCSSNTMPQTACPKLAVSPIGHA
jgi:Cu2+-containing amine oxidase